MFMHNKITINVLKYKILAKKLEGLEQICLSSFQEAILQTNPIEPLHQITQSHC